MKSSPIISDDMIIEQYLTITKIGSLQLVQDVGHGKIRSRKEYMYVSNPIVVSPVMHSSITFFSVLSKYFRVLSDIGLTEF